MKKLISGGAERFDCSGKFIFLQISQVGSPCEKTFRVEAYLRNIVEKGDMLCAVPDFCLRFYASRELGLYGGDEILLETGLRGTPLREIEAALKPMRLITKIMGENSRLGADALICAIAKATKCRHIAFNTSILDRGTPDHRSIPDWEHYALNGTGLLRAQSQINAIFQRVAHRVGTPLAA